MQPHPDWLQIEARLQSLNMAAISSVCQIYLDTSQKASFATQDGVVVLNTDVASSNLAKVTYLTMHELSHICLLHFERAKSLDAFRTDRTTKIFNIAADYSVDILIINSLDATQPERTVAHDHLKELSKMLFAITNDPSIAPEHLPTTEERYRYLLQKLSDTNNEAVLGVPTANLAQGKSEALPISIKLPQVNPFNNGYTFAGVANEVLAYKYALKLITRSNAWNRIYSYFKVTFGSTKWTDGHLSQRMMLNRSVGGLRLMSRKYRIDGTHTGNMKASHSDAIIFMDVSGSIERDWVDSLVGGIGHQLSSNNLKGATLVTYNSNIVDIIKLSHPSDVVRATLRLGGGTNINRTLKMFKEHHKGLLDKAKVIVVITDGEDAPINKDIDMGVPILSVVFTERSHYSNHFIEKSQGTVLHIPELI